MPGLIPLRLQPALLSRRQRSGYASQWRWVRRLGVTSTPTFFINGRKVVGFGNNTPYEVVKAMVDYNLTGAAK